MNESLMFGPAAIWTRRGHCWRAPCTHHRSAEGENETANETAEGQTGAASKIAAGTAGGAQETEGTTCSPDTVTY